MSLFCPNCGSKSVEFIQIDEQSRYYTNQKDYYKCSKCHASFADYDNGSVERLNIQQQEINDRSEYERLKAKYEKNNIE